MLCCFAGSATPSTSGLPKKDELLRQQVQHLKQENYRLLEELKRARADISILSEQLDSVTAAGCQLTAAIAQQVGSTPQHAIQVAAQCCDNLAQAREGSTSQLSATPGQVLQQQFTRNHAAQQQQNAVQAGFATGSISAAGQAGMQSLGTGSVASTANDRTNSRSDASLHHSVLGQKLQQHPGWSSSNSSMGRSSGRTALGSKQGTCSVHSSSSSCQALPQCKPSTISAHDPVEQEVPQASSIRTAAVASAGCAGIEMSAGISAPTLTAAGPLAAASRRGEYMPPTTVLAAGQHMLSKGSGQHPDSCAHSQQHSGSARQAQRQQDTERMRFDMLRSMQRVSDTGADSAPAPDQHDRLGVSCFSDSTTEPASSDLLPAIRGRLAPAA